MLGFSGLGLAVGVPVVRPRAVPSVGAALLCLLGLSAFLPQSWFPLPSWRASLGAVLEIGLAASVSPQPWFAWFWWSLLAVACLVSLYLQTLRLEQRQLAVLLHFVALFVGAYAVLSIFAHQTGWRYPFSGGAPFGFLPNRNHTATLLVVGAVLSVGLMQWEAVRGRRGAALLAALSGAPCLAGLLFFSISRAGVIFLVVGLVFWATGAARGSARRPVLALAAVLLTFLLALFATGENALRQRLVSVTSDLLAVPASSDAGRLDFRVPILRDTMRMIGDAPLTGSGLGQFESVFPQYRFHSARAARVLHPESDWLMVAAESGLPSAVLLFALVVWFVLTCWRARAGGDGPLRWAAASAVSAAVLHGFVDVPWHRPSLGWLLLAVAAVSVPPGKKLFSHPLAGRLLCALAGALLLGWSSSLGYNHYRRGSAPAPLRWETLERQMRQLANDGKMQEAVGLAREAVAFFPLKHEAYYYLGGFLRYYDETDGEIDRIFQAGRLAEPVLPQPVADQARLWKPIDAERQIKLSVEAVRRAGMIDAREQTGGSTGSARAVEEAVRDAGTNTGVQLFLAQELSGDPQLLALWFCAAPVEAAEGWAARCAGGAAALLDPLEPDLRARLLDRWISLSSASEAAAYMEARNGEAPGLYWRHLANYYAKAGDKPRAVGIVAGAKRLSLDPSQNGGGEFGAQLAQLQRQGNEVAMRRLLREAAEDPEADPGKAAVAMAYYAHSNDWEMAWKAASRLVTAGQNRQ